MSDYQKFIAWLKKTYPTHARAYSSDPVIQSAYFAGMAEGHKVCTSDEWLENATQATRDLANKIKGDIVTSASVIAGLEMALSNAAAMIERQQHVMKRTIDAWDTTTHQKNADGRLWQCMEELRAESHNALYRA